MVMSQLFMRKRQERMQHYFGANTRENKASTGSS